MSAHSKIEWTDATWNPVRGCSRVSEGCRNCYAERQAARFSGPGQPFEGFAKMVRGSVAQTLLAAPDAHPGVGAPQWTGKVALIPELLELPLHWKKPRRIFVNSMSDLFHEAVPDDVIAKVFGVMRAARRHTFQVLTKRPQRMHDWMRWITESADGPVTRCWLEMQDSIGLVNIPERAWVEEDDDDGPPNPWPLPNVWLGVSVEDQARADERIPLLLQTPAAVRFLSVEPLLGPVDLRGGGPVPRRYLGCECGGSVCSHKSKIDWVIVGGESGGPPERALVEKAGITGHPAKTLYKQKLEALAWVRSLRDQAVAAGVPFFFKQWGGPSPKSGGRTLDGRTWDEYPKGAA